MNQPLGVWIDHRKAIVVSFKQDAEKIETILSNIQKRARHTGGSRTSSPYGPQDIAAESSRDRKYQQPLSIFYNQVCRSVRKPSDLLILGPGEAKVEFAKHIEKLNVLRVDIRKIESSEKLTDRQLVAKVKEFFHIQKKMCQSKPSRPVCF